MKKIMFFAMALCMMSCASDYLEDVPSQEKETTKSVLVVNDDYKTMYAFVQDLVNSELFDGLTMPVNPSYDDLMHICAPIILTDVFGDTFAEGDCEKEYRLMLAYFEEKEPEGKIAAYLRYIIDNRMY